MGSGNPTQELASCIFTAEVKITLCRKLTAEVSFVGAKGETRVFYAN